MKTPALSIGHLTAGILLLLAPAAAAAVPVPVSPGGPAGGLAKDTCPTFSWSQGDGGGPYELVVYPVTAEGELGPEPALAARLPAGAQSWTPPADRCLQAGGRYAWTLREAGPGGEGAWSEPSLFRVSAAPSIQEVEAAMETLRRHLAERQVDGGQVRGGDSPDPAAEVLGPLAAARDRRPGGGEGSAGRVEASADAGIARDGAGAPAHIALADAPVLGSPSLTVSSDIALGAASNLFKEGSVFLWDDTSNTAVGRNALASATGTVSGNTAVGRHALENTIEGAFQLQGSNNTASGFKALYSNTTGNRNTASGFKALYSNTAGFRNTASGFYALYSNTLGSRNTAIGVFALASNTTGYRNTAVGPRAGRYATSGKANIFLGAGASGSSGETNTIRIGGSTGTGSTQQNRTFIAGIHGVTSSGGTGVFVNSSGQLGTTISAERFKDEVRDVGADSELLRALRPVAFRYRPEVVEGDRPLEYGLIAEEVAEAFPELVVFGEDGKPLSVRYHLLSVLLLNELQREHERNESQERRLAELVALRARVAALESSEPPPALERRSWWRRPWTTSASHGSREAGPRRGDRR